MFEFIYDLLCFCINIVLYLFGSALSLVFSFLPNSPFTNIINTYSLDVQKYLPYLSWLLPVKQMLNILTLWLSAMLLYYVYSVVLRWIKAIE